MFHGELAMTSSGPAVFNQPLPSQTVEVESVETRFGRVEISRAQAILFPTGLLGMPDHMHFALTSFPSPKMARFKLLQSLEDPSLSFITLPIELHNIILDRADIEQAAGDLEIPVDSLACLLIVTVSRDTGGAQLSVNARAPLFIHAARRVAGQYVFSHTKYDIRHPLAF
jgi:flagellar assembly factor FliW